MADHLDLSFASAASRNKHNHYAAVDAELSCTQVYNLTTYPNLIGLFEQLGVDTEPSEMSFAFSDQGSGLEWASHGLDTIFPTWKRCFSPAYLLMLYDVVRFGRQAPKVRFLGI